MALSGVGLCRGAYTAFQFRTRCFGVRGGLCPPRLVCTRTSLCLFRCYSSSKARHGIGRRIITRLKWANEKYEHFLQRHFPRFYILYHTFMRGFRHLFQDAKEVNKIKTRMVTSLTDYRELPYREMEKLRQFRRDMIKAIPLVIISVPPFANYIVFVLMYFFPRQLLIRHFWTPEQLVEFQGIYHAQRAQHHWTILKSLERAAPQLKDSRLQNSLLQLCRKVQSGAHPVVSDVHAVRLLFSGPPLGIRSLRPDQLRHLCPLLFLTPRLPAFLIGWRLNNHALELMHLDRAVLRLGLHQLNDSELKQACYVRGLNSDRLSPAHCKEWLSQWLQFSNHLKESETSLYLHSMVLLTVNYAKSPRC